MIKGSTQIQPTLKQGQRVRLDGRSGIIQEAGAFSIILRDDSGKAGVIPTKNIVDKDIVIESGPKPETQEQRIESQTPSTSFGSIESAG